MVFSFTINIFQSRVAMNRVSMNDPTVDDGESPKTLRGDNWGCPCIMDASEYP